MASDPVMESAEYLPSRPGQAGYALPPEWLDYIQSLRGAPLGGVAPSFDFHRMPEVPNDAPVNHFHDYFGRTRDAMARLLSGA